VSGRRYCTVATALVVVCVLAGCGGAPNIAAAAARRALQAAGFGGLKIYTYEDFGLPPIQEIVQKKYAGEDWPPIEVDHYTSNARAEQFYEGSYSRAALRSQEAYWRRYPVAARTGRRVYRGMVEGGRVRPRGFEIRKVLAFRICNVIVSSYNTRLDRRLDARVRDAARLMQANCR
jgi:hypothetical protein